MKNIEISDSAFLVISNRAQKLTGGDIADFIDRLIGVAKDRSDYEPLPTFVEADFGSAPGAEGPTTHDSRHRQQPQISRVQTGAHSPDEEPHGSI